MRYVWMLAPLLAVTAYGQRTRQPNELGFSFNGAAIALHTESSRSNSPLSTSGSVAVGNYGYAFRVVLDKENKPIFAYGLELRKAGPGVVTLRIKPIDRDRIRTENWGRPIRETGDVPTIAAEREFPPLRVGDAVQVDILYNPTTKETLWDVLRVVEDPQLEGKPVKGAPSGRLSFERVKVVIDGKTVSEHTGTWMIGNAIKMRVPGRGEYYLLPEPTAEFPFRASGWVDHNVLRFKESNESIEIVGMSNLLQHSEYGTVWVYHVPEAKVAKKAEYVDFTCAANMNQLLGRE